jgi:hypothetical protein
MNTFSTDTFLPAPAELSESDLDGVSGGASPLIIGAIAGAIVLLAEGCKAINDYEARRK